MEHCWNETDRAKQKFCPITPLSTKNQPQNDLGSNQGLRSEKLMSNRLSQCTA